jgi:hypothetical protein
VAVVAAALALACGGSTQVEPLSPAPDPATRATLAGPLCDQGRCTCRSDDAGAGAPAAGLKRFEIRLGPAEHALWATIGDMVFYKDRERATDCFYVDLGPGRHPVSLRGASDAGVAFRAAISEQGGDEERPFWYETFDFACGAPGACDRAELERFLASVQGKQGKLDPCGSTKARGITWHSSRMPEAGGPTDLRVAFELDVHRFAPSLPPGDPGCASTGGDE